jgi:Multiubiquitin
MSEKEVEVVVVEEIIDIEEYHKRGECPPKGKKYRFKVDGKPYVTHHEVLTGRQILEISEHTPADEYLLSQVLKGGHREPVRLDQDVDLTAGHIEKFKTLPKKQNEGA